MSIQDRIRHEQTFARASGKAIVSHARLADFLGWLDDKGFTHQRPPTGLAETQVVQVSLDGNDWQAIFRNRCFRHHYTVPKPLVSQLERFLSAPATPDAPMRRCEHCGCRTNARLRACCTAGVASDKRIALDRVS